MWAEVLWLKNRFNPVEDRKTILPELKKYFPDRKWQDYRCLLCDRSQTELKWGTVTLRRKKTEPEPGKKLVNWNGVRGQYSSALTAPRSAHTCTVSEGGKRGKGSGRRIEPGEEFYSDRKVSNVQLQAKSSSSGGFTVSVFNLLLNTFLFSTCNKPKECWFHNHPCRFQESGLCMFSCRSWHLQVRWAVFTS